MTDPIESTITFYKDLPHGKVTPPFNGAHWMQENHYFGASFEYLFTIKPDGSQERLAEDLDKPTPHEPKTIVRTVNSGDKSQMVSDRTVLKPEYSMGDAGQDHGQGLQAVSNPVLPPDGEGNQEPELDFAGWAINEVNYPFFQVKKAVLSKFPDLTAEQVQTKDSIITTLTDLGILAPAKPTQKD